MPDREVPRRVRPVTRSEIARDLRSLGVEAGGVLMVHTAMSKLGWVVGGEDALVMALLEALGPSGTLMAYAGWDEDPFHLESWPPEWQRSYLDELPGFDPALMVANHGHGRVPERIRTWPGARRSAHPEASIVAIGPRAEWIVDPHPDDDAFGSGTPLARLVEASGQVLLLGAPLESLTVLHHAEAIAPVKNKRRVSYRMPVADGGRTVWREYRDIDTSLGAFPYESLDLRGADAFDVIARGALQTGCGSSGAVGEATCYLFDAGLLVDFATRWMIERFGD